jgi:hypothetical protein
MLKSRTMDSWLSFSREPFLWEEHDKLGFIAALQSLVENTALASVANCLLHRFYNRCNVSGTKALTF